LKIRKLLKKKYIFLFATSFSGLFLNNFAEATVLNNSYKEVIDHVWQIVYRDFLDSNGKFQKSNWINLRKEVLSKTYSDSNEAYDAIREMLSNLDDSYTRFLEPKEANQMRIELEKEEILFEPSICYEAIFQTFTKNNPSVFVNITNDAWFGKTIGPKQHLASQIFRSIEKSVFFLRSANSGISVVVNNKGEILKKINLNSSGYIDISTQLSPEETFFEKHGNTSILLIILFLGLLFYLIEFLISLKRYN